MYDISTNFYEVWYAVKKTRVSFAKSAKAKKLKQEKDRLYNEALRKHEAIIRKLKEESNASKERAEYLNGLNILLQKIIEELREDLKSSAA